MTEAKLVAINNFMPQILWTSYFLEARGFEVNDNILFQDNQSTMKLAKKIQASSGKQTRHIKMQYFFVTDCINSKEIIIEYCPTKFLVGDFYSKPLQGMLFCRFQNFTMNINDGQNKNMNYFPRRQHVKLIEQSAKSNDQLQEFVKNNGVMT